MKSTAISIRIENPCSQNWNEMIEQEGKRFCASCEQAVIDFRHMPKAEIIDFFAKATSKICGRFRQQQLDELSYQLLVIPEKRNWGKYLGMLAIGASIFFQSCESEDFTMGKAIVKTESKISGLVCDESNKPISGVQLTLEHTNLYAKTDTNGYYEFKTTKDLKISKNLVVVNSDYEGSLIINPTKEKQDTLHVKAPIYEVMGDVIFLPPKK